MSGTINASDFEDSADPQNGIQNLFETPELQPFFKQLVKVGVSEALKEMNAKVSKLENIIDDKNYQIRELQHQKAILEDRLKIITSNVGDRDKLQNEIKRLNEEIDRLKAELKTANEDLEKERKSNTEKDAEIAQFEKDKILTEENDDRLAQLQKENDSKMAQLAMDKDAKISNLENEVKLNEEKIARIAQLEKEKNAEMARLKKEHNDMMLELNEEKDAKLQYKQEINDLKVEKQQANSQRNVALKKLKDLKQVIDRNN